jgi:hypothetical protein
MLRKVLLPLSVVAGLLLPWAIPVWACEKYADVVQDAQGTVVRNVIVTVKGHNAAGNATLYSESTCTLIQANPMLTNTEGTFSFYAPNGRYDITFEKPGIIFSTAFTSDRILFDPDDFLGGGGGGTSQFADLLSGTNVMASMIVGTGSSLTFSGSGSINASLFRGASTISLGLGGTGLTTAPDDSVLIGNGTAYVSTTLPNCLNPTTAKLLYDSATNLVSCGIDSGGTFDTLGAGTNTIAAMVVGSGATFTFSGSGTINASTYKGNTIVAVVDGGTNLTTATDDAVMIGNGTTWVGTSLPSCSNATTSKLLYDNTSNIFSCGIDQSAGGGTTFDTIGSGTNTTMAAVVGSGASLTPSGTGVLVATAARPAVVTVNAGAYTILTTDFFVLCDTTAATRTINLVAATNKQIVRVKNLGSNTCTVNRAGADTIDGGTSALLRNQFDAIDLVSDGSASWSVF